MMPRSMMSDAPATAVRPGSILVIDDEEIMREILEAVLTREGYEVRLAANAAEGLDLVRDSQTLGLDRVSSAA